MYSILFGYEWVTSSTCVAPASEYFSIAWIMSSGDETKQKLAAIVSSTTVFDIFWSFLGSVSLKELSAKNPASPDLLTSSTPVFLSAK